MRPEPFPWRRLSFETNVKVIASDRLDAVGLVVADNLAIYTSLEKSATQREPIGYTTERKYTELSVNSLISILNSIDLKNGFEPIGRNFARSRLTDSEPISRIIYWAYLNIRNIIESPVGGGGTGASRQKPAAIVSDLRALRGFDLFSHSYFKYLVSRKTLKSTGCIGLLFTWFGAARYLISANLFAMI